MFSVGRHVLRCSLAGVLALHDKQPTVAVIGAGISGLTCARTLSERDLAVIIFDKGRRPGGRMSTRETATGSFDHGCQFLTANEHSFRHRLQEWHRANVVRVWHGRVFELDSGVVKEIPPEGLRYVGAHGMQTVCQDLASGLTVRSDVAVNEVIRTETGWRLVDVSGNALGTFAAVVVAVPPVQAAALLREAPVLADVARSVPMAPCWTVMAAFPKRIESPGDGFVVRHSPLAWFARNSEEGQSNASTESWVLQASEEWSSEHLEDPKAMIEEQLLRAFFDATGSARQTPMQLASHRWRYANCLQPLSVGCLIDETSKIAACGDWCLGKNAEAAFQSGLAAADSMMAALNRDSR